MRDDTSDSAFPQRGDHIWLRQSVTFAVNGQTRTLELALPLRPGATPDEVESLLDEAEAGMRRLSRRLDAHLAEIIGAVQPTPASPAVPATPVSAPRHAPAPTPASTPQPASTPRAAPASATPTRPPAPSAPAPAAAPAAHDGPDLGRAEFLAAIVSELGLDAKAVMERLNVRSLTGLNLRETLDLLRRQGAHESDAHAQPTLATSAPAPTPEPEPLPAPIGRARFDEEEDGPDFELSYPDPDDLPGEDDDDEDAEDFAPQEVAPTPIASARAARSAASQSAAGPLGDVPDLDDLLGETPAPAHATPTDTTPAPDAGEAAARALIASLRASHAGGQPTEHQRTAYNNIVIDQLGQQKAAGVARALWNLTPDRLGPEQLDALIRWGKADAFAEEVEQVLALLRAEYRAQQAASQTQAPAATPARHGAARRDAAPREQTGAQVDEQPAESVAETPTPARPAARGRSSAR
ncbi:MAG: hypothetical protein KGO05_00810, partial [Chloroflexota bacterium]|nr:hypothetical protein [Chloroflexota bacterium]